MQFLTIAAYGVFLIAVADSRQMVFAKIKGVVPGVVELSPDSPPHHRMRRQHHPRGLDIDTGGFGLAGETPKFKNIQVGYEKNAADHIDDVGDEIVYDDDFSTTDITVSYDSNGNLTDDGTKRAAVVKLARSAG